MAEDVIKAACPACGAGLKIQPPFDASKKFVCPACNKPIKFAQPANATGGVGPAGASTFDKTALLRLALFTATVIVVAVLATMAFYPRGNSQSASDDGQPGVTGSEQQGDGGGRTGVAGAGSNKSSGSGSAGASGSEPTDTGAASTADDNAPSGEPATVDPPTIDPPTVDPPIVDPPTTDDPDVDAANKKPPVDKPPNKKPLTDKPPQVNPVVQMPLPAGPVYRHLPFVSLTGSLARPRGGLTLAQPRAAILLNASALYVSESGQQNGAKSATFTVQLWRRPTSNVVLSLTANNKFVKVTPSQLTLNAGKMVGTVQVTGNNPDTKPSAVGSSLTKATVTVALQSTLDRAYALANPIRTVTVWIRDDDTQGLSWLTLPKDLDIATQKSLVVHTTPAAGAPFRVALRGNVQAGKTVFVVVKTDNSAVGRVLALAPTPAQPSAANVLAGGAVVLSFGAGFGGTSTANPAGVSQIVWIRAAPGVTAPPNRVANIIIEPVSVVAGAVKTTIVNGTAVNPFAGMAPPPPLTQLDQNFFNVANGSQAMVVQP